MRLRKVPIIVGLTGKAGSGKSEFAQALGNYMPAPLCVRSFATPLKRMLGACGWDGMKDRHGRSAMQLFGTDVVRDHIARPVWLWQFLDSVVSATSECDDQVYVVVDDVRFRNELELIVNLGGIVLRIDREGACSPTTEDQRAHCSERNTRTLEVHRVIRNDGTIEDLCATARALVSFIAATHFNDLQTEIENVEL